MKKLKQDLEQKIETNVDKKEELKKFLVRVMPSMFNRTPDITGDLNKFTDDIINILK